MDEWLPVCVGIGKKEVLLIYLKWHCPTDTLDARILSDLFTFLLAAHLHTYLLTNYTCSQ